MDVVRTVQVSFHRDPAGRDPETLLEAWPTLGDVAEAAAGAGVAVDVVHAAMRDDVIERNGVTYHWVRDPCLRAPRGRDPLVLPLRLGWRVRALAPDVVHLHGFTTPVATWWLQQLLPATPMVVQDHGGVPARGWRRLVAAACWRALAAVCFTDRDQAQPFMETGQLRSDVRVFDVPESSTHFTPGDREQARARLGVRGKPCLAWVGRLNDNKDPLTVLDAVAQATPLLPDPHLWLCYGDAPLQEAVRERIARNPTLARRVHLLGTLPHRDVECLLRASDFLMLASHREGSGYAVLEALACGVTPVVTDIPSFRRLTDRGRVGALSPLGDAAAMARSLCRWWGKPESSRRRLALDFFTRQLSFPAVGRQLRTMYETLRGEP